MERVHAASLLHRDLKPSNVLLRGSVEPVLIDFGFIRRIEELTPLTRPGALVGTPEYFAPELISGTAASAHSDLFAIGCMGYRMLAGSSLHGDSNIKPSARASPPGPTSPRPPSSSRRSGRSAR